jgi:hypothetical protein
MQTRFSSSVLGNDGIALPLPRAIKAEAAPHKDGKASSARRIGSAVKEQRTGPGIEEIAWFLLAASSLAAVVAAI